MKNKRTKLTALLLSALMAVSTISSVTWAADLFSDGSEGAEVTVETSIVSDEVEADDEVLTGVGTADIESVVFKYDNADPSKATKVVAEFTLSAVSQEGGPYTVDATPDKVNSATCTSKESIRYSATLKGDSGDITVFSDNDKIDSTGTVSIDPSIEDPNKPGYIITLGQKEPTGHVLTYPVFVNEKYSRGGVPFVIEPATHGIEGRRVYYRGCSVCGAFIPTSDKNATVANGGVVEQKPTQTEFWKLADTNDTYLEEIAYFENYGENAHVYDESSPIILKDTDFTYTTVLDTTSPVVAYNGSYILDSDPDNQQSLKQYAPYNCVWDPDDQVMKIQNTETTEDAYYFRVVKCKYCNTVKYYDVVELKDAPNERGGVYYEQADLGNIYGFFVNGKKNECYLFPNVPLEIQSKIKAAGVKIIGTTSKIPASKIADPPEPIFMECGKMGYYYIRTYVEGTREPVYEEFKEASSVTHVWGTVEVAPKSTMPKLSDGTIVATEDEKILKADIGSTPTGSISNGFVVVRDSSGNVTDVKSINCVTSAKYQLYHQCAICGKTAKVGDLKTAGPNLDMHDWGDWSNKTDDSDNKYYQIETEEEHDKYHIKYTYYHRTCKLCGKRDLKLASEVKEAHKLVETKYDDNYDKDGVDSTLVPPTCGKDGSYDVILRCACRFEDDKSRKPTKIPATDQHDFTGSDPELIIVGSIQVGGRRDQYGNIPVGEQEDNEVNVVAQIVRKCNKCSEYDSNGINNTVAKEGDVGPSVYSQEVGSGRTFSDYVPAKINPKTGLPYPCSVGKITVKFDWGGKVDGEPYILTGERTVLYYPNRLAYQGAKDRKRSKRPRLPS